VASRALLSPPAERIAAVFSSATFRWLAQPSLTQKACRLEALIDDDLDVCNVSLGEAFDRGLTRLVQEYRSEYVYKNSIVSKLILGKHSPRTASALLEQHMGASLADVLILNGTATAYEIKSDLDQYSRLGTQLRDYATRVEYVYVVASEKRMAELQRRVPGTVGLVALTSKGILRTIQHAESNLNLLDATHIFGMLRTSEAARAHRRITNYDLSAPSGELRTRLESAFEGLDPMLVHHEMTRELRIRASGAADVVSHPDFPKSLRALAYAVAISAAGKERLMRRLSEPVALALGVAA